MYKSIIIDTERPSIFIKNAIAITNKQISRKA